MELERQGGDEHLRVSDREREQVVELLGQAAAEGRLTLDEYAERAGAAHSAVTRGELARLTHDLPTGLPHRAPASPSTTGGSERVIAIFASESRTGAWPVPERLEARAVFGDCQIELQDAQLQHEVTRIEATAMFGSVTVRVPEGVDVRMTGMAVFGSKESKLRGPVAAGAPIIEIRCQVAFGSVTVEPPRKRKRWW
ncbi:DUF1707 SHOCT-like domain-containing protein [Micromonospora pattaloongensis]|uniref:DUF1707 SHOCT-like domain-containing protein n=1 Tax=Micromonospora pattaloongensis TaxID=405436 RepID=UPI0015875D25|nr:DUF1707 domain-containing protein [Micromonospora pattaloongensis]